MSGIWKFLNTPFSLLLFGFVLTSIFGATLAAWLQLRNWKKQTQLTLFQKRYDEGVIFLDALSDLVGRRYFLLQRYFWAIEDPTAYKLDSCSEEYFACVRDWNTRLRTMRNKARLLIGEERALQFLDYHDDDRPEYPRSLHYIFAKAHRNVHRSRNDKGAIAVASKEIEQLNFTCSQFLEDFTTEFLKRAREIRLVELPNAISERKNPIE
jgi:hypothetical protein